jgi:hypothetical protein
MSDSVKQTLLATFRVLLGPLVRILLRQGISYGEFSEVAKAVYVEIALKDFQVAGRRATKTRLAVMTGLTRKEVKRVVDEANKERFELRANFNRLGRVLVGWHTDPDFTGPYGLPLELQYETTTPNNVTVTELVKRHSGDMSPRSILDELIRVGAVRETDKGWYRVLRRDYIPEAEGIHNFERVGSVIRNFINTIDFNMTKTAPGKGRFERLAVADDGMRNQDIPRFDAYLRERCQTMLEEVDNWITNQPKPDRKKGDVVIRTGIGIYHYMNDEEEERTFKKLLIDEGLISGSDDKD